MYKYMFIRGLLLSSTVMTKNRKLSIRAHRGKTGSTERGEWKVNNVKRKEEERCQEINKKKNKVSFQRSFQL